MFASSNVHIPKVEQQDRQIRDEKNRKAWHYGENGEDGQNGGHGGKGRPGLLRGGNGGSGGNALDSSVNGLEETHQNIDEIEYLVLKEMCQQVIFTTIAKFCDPLDEACLLSDKKVISAYTSRSK